MDTAQLLNQDFFVILTSMTWLIHIVTVLIAMIFFWWLEGRLFQNLIAKTKKTANFWDESIVQALHAPVRFIISALGILYILSVLVERFTGLQVFEVSINISTVLVSNAFFLWFFLGLINNVENALYSRPSTLVKYSKTTIRAVSQVLSIMIVIAIALNIIYPVFGVPISALLAFGGIGGIAVALACQDILSNVFGGFLIYSERPFDIGDWVSSPDREIVGIVEYIGLRLTRIRTFDKAVRYVPNSVFSKVTVDNYSRMSHRRVRMTIGIRYQDAEKLQYIIEKLDAMLHKDPNLDTSLTTFARFAEFAESSINIQLYAFTKKTGYLDYFTVMQGVALQVIQIIKETGAEMAFPSRTLYMAEGVSALAEMEDRPS